MEGLTGVPRDFTVPSEGFSAERKGKREAPDEDSVFEEE